MLPDATFDPAPPRTNLRLRFSLLSLFVFVTLVCICLAWLVQPNLVVATALFQVQRAAPSLLGADVGRGEDERDFETLKRTQVALIKSNFVAQSALRNPSVATLPLLQRIKDPVEWLQSHLEVDFPEDGDILAIRLGGLEAHATDLVRLVDAVAKAYQDEIIYREKQRQLTQRDMLARSLSNLTRDIDRKWGQLQEMAKDSGRLESGSGQIEQELDVKALDRLDAELLRLETEQLRTETTGKADDSDWIARRIAQLRERQAELQKRIIARGNKTVELIRRERELERLQQIAEDMSVKLERMDIEAAAPDRIWQIQSALTPAR